MYVKIFSTIFDGSLASVGPWEALVTFENMLILADSEGIVDMTPEAIIRRSTIPKEIILKGIESLEMPDPHSRTPEEDGRRIVRLSNARPWGWRIVNYFHYRNMRNTEDRREYMKNYQREFRKRCKPSVNSRKQNKPKHNASASAFSLNSFAERFEKFWHFYPSRNGKKLEKGKSQKIFQALTESDQILVITAAQNYANSQRVLDGVGIRDPSRFLKNNDSGEFWRDWIEPENKTCTKVTASTIETCTRQVVVDGHSKACDKIATFFVGKTAMCPSCHDLYQRERAAVERNGASHAN